MLILFVVNILTLVMSTSAANDGWYNDRLEKMTPEVQTHFQNVLAERYTRLYWDMYQACNGTYQPQVVFHLHIVNVTRDQETLDKAVHWEIKQSPCSLSVYSTMDEVLQNWCKEQPSRMLTFPYKHTADSFWTNDPNFMAVVQTTCHLIPTQVDPQRLPLPEPFDIRRESFNTFMIYFVPSIILLIVIIFLYGHRVPICVHSRTRWSNYWDKREWEKIRDIVEYREHLIKEEQKKQMMEKEKKFEAQTSIDME